MPAGGTNTSEAHINGSNLNWRVFTLKPVNAASGLQLLLQT